MKKMAMVLAIIMAMLSVTTAWAEVTVRMDQEQANAYAEELWAQEKYAEALAVFSQLALQNYAPALYRLGYAYQYGKGVEAAPAIAEQYLLQAAELGNADAMYSLAYGYRHGYFGEDDSARAFEWYTKAAELGHGKAMNNLGVMYASGDHIKQDYQRAAELYTAAAEKGNVQSMINIGRYFFKGTHQEPDYAQAEKWLTMAAEAGTDNSDVFRYLGDIYYNGYLGQADYLKAQPMYEKASAAGDATASTNLGNMFYLGYGVEKDVKKAEEYFLLAHEQGNRYASVYVADRCLTGEFAGGVEKAIALYTHAMEKGHEEAGPKLISLYLDGAKLADGTVLAEPDHAAALALLQAGKGDLATAEKAADVFEATGDHAREQTALEIAMELGCTDPHKIYDLGAIHYYGYVTGTPDYAAARPLLEKASGMGEVNGSILLANMYVSGYGVEKSAALYEKYLTLAVEQGSGNALTSMGNAYRYGWFESGVNVEKAIEWYQRGIAAGKVESVEALATIYTDGVTVDGVKLAEVDFEKALPLLEKAYQMGTTNAYVLSWLGYFYKGNAPMTEPDYAKALGVFTMAAELGDSYSMEALGDMYCHGYGVTADAVKAAEWYAKAVEQGSVTAQNKLDALGE